MPDPTFKIDGATVLSKSGTTVSVDSGVKFPAGHIVNTHINNYTNSSTSITASMAAGGSASNPDSLVNNDTNSTFSSDSRVFVKLVAKTVSITSGNGVIVSGWVGHPSITISNRGAFGCVFKIPDSSGNNRAYMAGNYNWYTPTYIGNYVPDWSGIVYAGPGSGNSNDTIGTGNIEIAIYGYAYNESSGNATMIYKVRKAQLVIHEVQV